MVDVLEMGVALSVSKAAHLGVFGDIQCEAGIFNRWEGFNDVACKIVEAFSGDVIVNSDQDQIGSGNELDSVDCRIVLIASFIYAPVDRLEWLR